MADRALDVPDLAASPMGEAVKLVIWDLDETFWRGTLSEGGIEPIAENVALVKALSARGIVNSICSKNDFAAVREVLTQLGVWEYFIFPRIAFAPKGAMVKEIIDAAQLRAPSVLFIDDHVMNLHEALHYNPGLKIAEPPVLSWLLTDQRCAGKPDPAMERLARYKVLEQKQSDQSAAGGDNIEFLRSSDIRVSFHYDVLEQFPRIHDLVNRTNQLNFTKLRWPEDEASANIVAEEEYKKIFNSHWGYVKVGDRYGNYGICGFFLLRHKRAVHFLFSCRAMNMGVEQFVWHRLGQPAVRPQGEVSSRLGVLPDWIRVVEDADMASAPLPTQSKPVLCLRGACDLSMMAHYLRTNFDTVEEYQYPFEGWAVHRVARELSLGDERQAPDVAALLAKTPGVPVERFASAINTGAADVYVLSYSSEVFGGFKRSRSTGVIVPLYLSGVGNKEFSSLTYEQLTAVNENIRMSPEQWRFLQDEYETAPFLDEALLTADLHRMFKKLAGKRVVVLQLNTSVGRSQWHLDIYRRINSIVLPVAWEYGCHIVDLAEFVCSTDDLVDPEDIGVHYARDVYRRLAAKIEALVSAQPLPMSTPAATPVAPPSVAKGNESTAAVDERGTGNHISIDETAKLKTTIRVHGNNNRLYIGKNVQVHGTILEIVGNDCSVILHEGVVWRGIIRCRHDDAHLVMGKGTTSMHAVVTLHEAGTISIGEDCMFSGDVRMDVSDMHSIMDRTSGQRLNKAKNITIGDHVWLAQGVTVAKGCTIGSGTVVGAKSLAHGDIPANVVVAGVPAKIIRENVEWNRKRL